MRPGPPLVELKRAVKTYWLGATPVRALRGVTLTIREGEFVAVMGPSGSGKSTLMHVIGLLDGLDGGTYRLAGRDVSRLSPDEQAAARGRLIGFVFQSFNLLPRLTALANIELPRLYGGALPAAPDPARLAAALNLADRAAHRPSELSGGQQQRVAIARALVNGPALILADEPTGNLDSRTQGEILELLTGLNRSGLTIVLVTHEPDVARWARRVIWMRDGRLVSDRRQVPAWTRRRARAPLPAARPGATVPPTLGPLRPPAAGRLAAAWAGAGSHVEEAVRSLASNKARAALSMLGITIGVGAVIAMLALGTGAKRDMADRFVRFGSNVVTVHSTWWRTPPRGLRTAVPRLSYDDALAIARAHAGIVAVSPAVSRDASVSAGGQQRSCNVVGTTPANVEIRNLHPPLGRFFTDRENLQRARVALLGRTVSRELFGEAANPVGREIKINRIPFTVIGVLPERGSYGRWDPDDVVYVPLFTNMYRVIGRRYVDYVEVKIAQEADVDEVIEGIHRHLQQRYRLQDGDSDAFDVRNEVAWRQAYSEMTRTLSLLLGVIAGISLIVGGIGIMNIMLVTVTERTREIGLRKAVGARGRDILLQFLIEAAAISVIGGVLGILLGILSAKAVAWTLHWTVAITPWSVGLAFGFSAAVGLVFGFWPARRAARLHPAEALRSE